MIQRLTLLVLTIVSSAILNGAVININASSYAAQHPGIQMQIVGYSNCVPASQNLSINLNPGYYQLNFCGTGGDIFFYVQQNGTIAYNPAYQNMVSGQNGTTLIIYGGLIKVDATQYFQEHANAQFKLNGLSSCSSQPIQSYVLVPGTYTANFCNVPSQVTFNVDANGRISYSNALSAICSGGNTTTLMIKGAWISYDATALNSGSQYQNPSFFGCTASNIVRSELMLPGTYQVNLCNTTNYTFSVLDNGTISVPVAFSAFLGGDGSSTLKFFNPNPFTADAGGCATVYSGYGPASCVTLNGTATNGTAPYTYQWSNNVAGPTNTVCPTATTAYTLTVTDATGAVTTAEVTVYVENVACGNNNNKVLICHIPPGNPNNPQTLCVAPAAVPAHLAHGDVLGSCSSANCNNARLLAPEVDVVTEEQELLVYPNPASGSVTAHFATPTSGQTYLTIMSPDGRAVYSNTTAATEGVHYDEQIDLSGFASGIYIMELKSDSGISTVKFVVE